MWFLELIWLIAGMALLATSIYGPCMDGNCEGHCGSLWSSARKIAPEPQRVYRPVTVTEDLNEQLARARQKMLSVQRSQTPQTQHVLRIENGPILQLARLALEEEKRHHIELVVVGAKEAEDTQDPFMLTSVVHMAHALAKEGADVIMDHMADHSVAWTAWNQLVDRQILLWPNEEVFVKEQQQWAHGTIRQVDPKKSVSEYLVEIMDDWMEWTREQAHPYYTISRERETELKEAYKEDTIFKVDNVTTAYHALVLKALFPALYIQNVVVDDEPTTHAQAFLEHYVIGH